MTPETSYRFKRIVIVSYRLPFRTVVVDGKATTVQNSGGLVSAISALSQKSGQSSELFRKIVWVGNGDPAPDDVAPDKPGILTQLLRKYLPGARAAAIRGSSSTALPTATYQIIPVVIDKELNDKYYGGFCNDHIWPLFHYFPTLVVHDESYFDSYVTANKVFAEKLKAILQPDDFVWIHDYQLFLLPELIRQQQPNAHIGFFLHIPFPAFEIFRNMPRRWGVAILKGMLGADLIGFHTYDYSQYFLRTVSRLLGHETTMNTVAADDRLVRVDSYPIGIDYEKYNGAATHSKEAAAEKQRVLSTLQGMKLIFSVDRLDYSKGLLQRLEAFERFLETFPDWIEKIVFNMVVVPSRDTIPQYQRMKREIEAAVGRINGKYSTMAWRPLVYQYKSLSFSELVALYDTSLVGLITPLRDGMNLVAKEYVACQVAEKGVLILSEMAGAAAELGEAILINPADKREVAEAINKALGMPLRERSIRIARMQRRIKTYTVFTWVKDILDSVESVKKDQEVRKVNLVTPATESKILGEFKQASHRAVFLDYDGTLVPFSRIPELAIPGAQTIAQLQALAANPRNTVVLISGRDKDFLGEWFGALAVHLIAEHGAFQKAPGAEWVSAIDADQSWKSTIAPVLQRYTGRCNGSFIEEKSSSLAWHYRNSTPEIGLMRANELREELRTLVAHESKLQVLDGDKVVEVKRTGYDKGSAALKFVSAGAYDFIMALGDDKTDEDIFRALPPEAVTIKIGTTASVARHHLANQEAVSRFVDRLIECS